MNKDLINIFNIILSLKGMKKDITYKVSKEDNRLLIEYWKIYHINKHLSLGKFRNAVINYSILANVPFYKACEELCKKITLE